jgi:hypothetical protein
MHTLIDNFKRFNAKERFFLVGKILGNEDFNPTAKFIRVIESALGLKIEKIEFSAMDYHLDWIYAALAITNNENEVFENTEKLIRGQQEDIDFIMSYADGETIHIILIEAKATTSWTNEQLTSKAGRLRSIFGNLGDKWNNVMPHFVIASPTKPMKIVTSDWPVWMKRENEVPWIELEIPDDLRCVTRCSDQGQVSAEGNFWKVLTR